MSSDYTVLVIYLFFMRKRQFLPFKNITLEMGKKVSEKKKRVKFDLMKTLELEKEIKVNGELKFT